MLDAFNAQGYGFRDDSPLVGWYDRTFPKTFGVRSPEIFDRI